jgi:hypothetical protein
MYVVLCPFSKNSWYYYPWFIKTELIVEHHHFIPNLVQALITSQHLQINSTNITLFCGVYEKIRTHLVLQESVQAIKSIWGSKCNYHRSPYVD